MDLLYHQALGTSQTLPNQPSPSPIMFSVWRHSLLRASLCAVVVGTVPNMPLQQEGTYLGKATDPKQLPELCLAQDSKCWFSYTEASSTG